MNKIIIPLLAIFIFTACSFKKDSTPEWITNPEYSMGDKRVAVGCSAMHIDGISAQEKLATQRAIDSIAMQKQSNVSNVTLRSKSSSSGNLSSSTMQSSSLHQVNNLSVSTKVLDKYTNKDGDICVLVVEE